MLSESTRAYVYRIALVLLPVLIAYGLIGEQDAALWVAVLGAVLVPGLAAVNTSTSGV